MGGQNLLGAVKVFRLSGTIPARISSINHRFHPFCRRWRLAIVTGFSILVAAVGPNTEASGGVAGRLAVSCDGNLHDHDDINSSAWELAMCAKAGRVADLVYFGYADHYWMNDSTMESS